LQFFYRIDLSQIADDEGCNGGPKVVLWRPLKEATSDMEALPDVLVLKIFLLILQNDANHLATLTFAGRLRSVYALGATCQRCKGLLQGKQTETVAFQAS
jgi:hypothetical protein